jgi:hypothetical protein
MGDADEGEAKIMQALLLLIAGAIVGGVGQILFAIYTSSREGIGLAIALKAEIESLLVIVEMRRYLPDLETWVAVLEASSEPIGPEEIYAARIEQDYFGVFHSVRAKIGLLGTASVPVVKAYAFGKSFLEDARDLETIRDRAAPGSVSPQMLAIKVRGTHQVLARAIQSANQAVAELDTFIRGRGWLGT